MKRIKISITFILFIIPIFGQQSIGLLKKVSENIENINNVSYRVNSYGGEPDDTVFHNNYDRYEFYTKNDKDSIVKTFYYITKNHDSSKVSMIYDGTLKHVRWDNNTIRVDSVNSPFIKQLPYYPVHSPMLIRIKSLIDYSINNPDNTEIHYTYYKDSTKIKFDFPNNVFEFINMKPWDVKCPHIKEEDFHSSYTIWINDEKIPYKQLREVRTERRLSYIQEFEIKKYESFGVLPDVNIPSDFKYVDMSQQIIEESSVLENKMAPEFSLFSPFSNTQYSLDMYKGKVVLLVFSGIGCGHCKAAISYLNELKNKHKDIVIIGVETFVDKPEYIKNYIDYHKIGYDYLIASNTIKEAYSIRSVPHFFILDKDLRIIKSIKGYKIGYTDEVLTEGIMKILE